MSLGFSHGADSLEALHKIVGGELAELEKQEPPKDYTDFQKEMYTFVERGSAEYKVMHVDDTRYLIFRLTRDDGYQSVPVPVIPATKKPATPRVTAKEAAKRREKEQKKPKELQGMHVVEVHGQFQVLKTMEP